MKVYKYKGKLYSDEDLQDERCCGDLYDLYWELKKDGLADEETHYYASDSDFKERYESYEELLEKEQESLEIEEVDVEE